MRTILLCSLLIACLLPACVDDRYSSDTASKPADKQPGPDLTPSGDQNLPGLTVAPTLVDATCEVQAPLTRDDLQFDNAVVVDAPRVEDHVAVDGRLTGRTLRGEGWQRDEQYNLEGCLGILTLHEFNENGEPLLREVIVLDGQLAFDLSPYGGIVPSLTTWTYDDEGRLVRWGVEGQQFSYSHDADGNVIREEAPYGDEPMVTTRTFDEHGQLLTEIATHQERELWRVTNTWDGADRPLTTTREQGDRTSSVVRWDYDGQVLVRRISTEDWAGDARPERSEVETYDRAGRKLSFTQDQPYDGRDDWRETFTYDGDGNLLHHESRNLLTNEVAQDRRYTYDEEGRKLTETHANGRRSETDYDEAGRVIRLAWFQPGGQLQTETHTTFATGGAMLRTETDRDGDGVIDNTSWQELDVAGQPVLSATDWDADGTPEASILRLWR